MKKKFLVLLAVVLVAIGGLTACDPSPPYEGCEFLAAGEAYRGNGLTYSVPWASDYVDQLEASGWDVQYNGSTNMWYTQAYNSTIVHGYSVEEDEHWWSCPV